ncbi:MAG: ATP-binding protein [Actinomycetota bacterium]|nr:ATP-binding protein [Actinomycetota bacterium]
MRLTFSDEPTSAAKLRSAVERLGAEQSLPPAAVFDLKLAATEALANALIHGSGPVEVTLGSSDGAVEIEVSDRGGFKAAADVEGERGRGIPLMVALVDEVEFTSARDGTRIRLRKRTNEEPSSRRAR